MKKNELIKQILNEVKPNKENLNCTEIYYVYGACKAIVRYKI